jgi:hypothetical protein
MFMALRRVTLCPWRIGAITAAALVVLYRLFPVPGERSR